MELENSENKKKIILRNERISELENNSKELTNNNKYLSERHVEELNYLRELIQVFYIIFYIILLVNSN